MIWRDHSKLEGKHAFLSASKYHWINYDDQKLYDSFKNHLAVERGTRLHAFASECIKLNQKLQNINSTLNMFVNDSINFKMESEKVLYYSDNCFGTADAISFSRNKLLIFDLKTGETQAHMEQLEIYAALFCLEYKKDPRKISIQLRIYQHDDVLILDAEGDIIYEIMEKIKHYDKLIDDIKVNEGIL